MSNKLISALLCFAVSFSTFALGNKKAPKSGTLKMGIGADPTTLNPLSSTDAYASMVQKYVMDRMLYKNEDTWKWQPGLATSWVIKNDGMVFEYKLRKGVKWHDGVEFTSADVKFTIEAILDKKNRYQTARWKAYLENIEKVETPDKYTVIVHAKKKYVQNFFYVSWQPIVPKHLYEDLSKKNKKKRNKTIVGTGPYKFKKWKRNKSIELVRNKDWWGLSVPEFKRKYNFEKRLFKIIKDDTVRITSLEKGKINFMGLSIENYQKKTNGVKWTKELKKTRYSNSFPVGYSFLAFNMKDPIFRSKTARHAVYKTFDRKKMIKKFYYGHATRATGPDYKKSQYADKSVKAVEFDPKGALEMLRKDGWKDTDGDRILDKIIDGKKRNFSFTILEPWKEFEKFLTVAKEEAKKIGIEINIKYMEWNSFIKLLNERKFEAVRLAWTAGESLHWDPKQIWHSDSIKNEGSNFISYSRKDVDQLIDKARVTLDISERKKILKRVYKTIANDYPYIFLFNRSYYFYGHHRSLKKEKNTYKYNLGIGYWWMQK